MGYGIAVPIIFWYFVIRVWILHSRRIAVLFVALWLVAAFGVPRTPLPMLASPLAVIFLTIVLLLIDRYQSTLRRI